MLKKVILSIVAAILLLAVSCGCSRTVKDVSATNNAEQSTVAPTTATIPSTTKLDVSSLSNKEFAEKVAKDLSTNSVLFSVRSVEDSIAFLDAKGTDKINAHVGFADFGNSITLSFRTDGSEDE